MSFHCTSTGGTKKELVVGPCTGNFQFLMRHGAKHFADAKEELGVAHLYGEHVSPFSHLQSDIRNPSLQTPDATKQFYFTTTILLRVLIDA